MFNFSISRLKIPRAECNICSSETPIRGVDNRHNYAIIDLTKTAEPLPSDSESENEKEKNEANGKK